MVVAKKRFVLSKSKVMGLIFIVLGFMIYSFRPFKSCEWYDIGCKTGSFTLTPIFIIIMMVLIVVGVVKLIKK